MRFAELKLKEPEKAKVWDYFINHKEFKEDRIASFILLKGVKQLKVKLILTLNKSQNGMYLKTLMEWCCSIILKPYSV